MIGFRPPRLGWQRDLPDPRDYTPAHDTIRPLLARLKRRGASRSGLPSRTELREYCAGVPTQGPLRSCTADALVGLVEYFERRASGRCLEGSSMFLYQVTRRLLETTGDCGADLRTTFKALVRFGVPPARYWPNETAACDREPEAFLYSFTKDYLSIQYVRLDPAGASGAETLARVKAFLAAGFACAFGFAVPSTLTEDQDIPFPTRFDMVEGGHSVLAVGYDDTRRIRSTKGALLIRNSWGPAWGDHGYGWLPFRYVQERLAVDFWTLLKDEWLASGEFEQPR